MKTAIMTLIISVLLLSDHVVLGQEGEWTVVTANGDVFVNVAPWNSGDDTLRFSQTGRNFTIPITSIVQLRKKERKSRFWKGAGIGLVAGAIIGGVVGVATYDSGVTGEFAEAVTVLGPIARGRTGAILGGLGGMIVGGAIQSLSQKRERVYTFSDDTQIKSVEIRAALANK